MVVLTAAACGSAAAFATGAVAVFSASPPKYTDLKDEIDIPDAMMDALIKYVAYIGQSTINKDNVNESAAYFQRFQEACRQLDNDGYKIPICNETIDIALKGYK